MNYRINKLFIQIGVIKIKSEIKLNFDLELKRSPCRAPEWSSFGIFPGQQDSPRFNNVHHVDGGLLIAATRHELVSYSNATGKKTR